MYIAQIPLYVDIKDSHVIVRNLFKIIDIVVYRYQSFLPQQIASFQLVSHIAHRNTPWACIQRCRQICLSNLYPDAIYTICPPLMLVYRFIYSKQNFASATETPSHRKCIYENFRYQSDESRARARNSHQPRLDAK